MADMGSGITVNLDQNSLNALKQLGTNLKKFGTVLNDFDTKLQKTLSVFASDISKSMQTIKTAQNAMGSINQSSASNAKQYSHLLSLDDALTKNKIKQEKMANEGRMRLEKLHIAGVKENRMFEILTRSSNPILGQLQSLGAMITEKAITQSGFNKKRAAAEADMLGFKNAQMGRQAVGSKLGANDPERFEKLQETMEKLKTDEDEFRKKGGMGKQTGFGKLIGGLTDKFEQWFGEGSKIDKMTGGKGKTVGMGMIGGAALAGGALGKAIIDSSPLMQQMMKLWKFGIMLILRPIGDFFAMLFRPILLLLLRKFIIPFYQTVYPWFMKHAKGFDDIIDAVDDLGTVALPAAISSFNLALKASIAGIGLKITEALKPKELKAAEAELEKTKKDADDPKKKTKQADVDKAKLKVEAEKAKVSKPVKIITSITEKFDKVMLKAAAMPMKIITGAGSALKKLTNAATLNVANKTTKVISNAVAPATKSLAKVGAQLTQNAPIIQTAAKMGTKMASRAIPIAGQALLAVDIAGSAVQAAFPEAYKAVNQGIRAGGAALGIPDWMTEGALDFVGWGERSTAQQLGDLAGMATQGNVGENNFTSSRGRGKHQSNFAGGMIKEPVFGFGKSGRTYSFGERGAEMVTPMGGMGGGSTINITVNGSIYSDKDMLNFQRTIMRAIEASNTRRSRL